MTPTGLPVQWATPLVQRQVSAWQLTAYPATPGQDDANLGYAAVEVRVFDRAASAAVVFGDVQRLLADPTGQECLAETIARYYGVTRDRLTLTPTTVIGAEVGYQMEIETQTFTYFVDLSAVNAGDGCLVFVSLVAQGDPLDADGAAGLLRAARLG